MLSYRHAFHAGNFADVLKHLIQVSIIEHLKQKDKPFCYIDTHAGPGLYDLCSEYALLNREFDTGIGKIWHREDVPACAAAYVDAIRSLNGSGHLSRYPGSPWLAQKLLRPNDRLYLYELHSTEFMRLNTLFAKDRRIQVHHSDGLQDAVGLLPPSQRRALVLIDPSYELKADYQKVVETLNKMHRRFATGIVAIWYPVIESRRHLQLERSIRASGIDNVQLYELSIRADAVGRGMSGSGMIVVNPPWTLADHMLHSLRWLSLILGEGGEGAYRIERLAGK
ncbi:MAG: 23S rRNA (adenine(2030)-N(6))-methyltransferase RlmJ [Gammaproteobacteria bacterium]